MVLIGFVGLCLLVALADMAVTQRGIRGWYPSLRHPIGTPPAWVFPVVWVPIYVVMAVAAWRVWRWNPLDRLRDASLPATPAASRPVASRPVPGRLVREGWRSAAAGCSSGAGSWRPTRSGRRSSSGCTGRSRHSR